MPSTVNGIGTHYYGKKNRSVRQGVCNSCHRQVQLESYDTRLFFVFVFIPIIPLGRKRIMDLCPVCQRHYASKLDEWTAARQLEISSAKESYRSSPTLENAFQAHIEALRFRSFDEAEELRKEFEEHHANSAELWSGLGAQLEQLNEYGTAKGLYQRAFDLDPDDPMARNGVALAKLNEGKLDECRKLLSHLMEPGAGQLHSMAVMDYLAAAYQRNGEHENALELCEVLIREIPQAANDRDFRKFVQKSEKAAGRGTSLLTKRERGSMFESSGASSPGQRKAFIWGIVLFVACVALAIHNNYVKGHRAVRLYNSLAIPAQVSIDGGPPVQVAGQTTISLSEGHHQAKITGPLESQVDFDMQAGFFDRWFSSPLWVIDVGGGSVFTHSTVYYSQQQRPSDNVVIMGRPFISYDDVDYQFIDPPDSIRMKKNSSEIVKTVFQKVSLPPAEVIRADIPGIDAESHLRFAEAHLTQKPVPALLARGYRELAYKRDAEARATSFLKAGLASRPVDLNWHRMYQSFRANKEGHAALVPEYDALLKADPNNAALIYLRARIEDDWQKSRDLYSKAIEIDPKLEWAWRGIAFADAGRADWKGFVDAIKNVPDKSDADEGTQPTRRWARIATGDVDNLKKEMTALSQNPAAEEAIVGAISLYELLQIEGNAKEAAACLENLKAQIFPQVRSNEYQQIITDTTDYMAGNVTEIAARPMPSMAEVAYTWIHAALAAGKPELVQDAPTTNMLFKNPATALCVALAWQLKGDSAAATQWAERAAARCFASLTPDESKKLLLGETPPSIERLNSLAEEPDDLALLAAWLMARYPNQRSVLEPYIKARLHFRSPPALLIQQVLKAAPAGN